MRYVHKKKSPLAVHYRYSNFLNHVSEHFSRILDTSITLIELFLTLFHSESLLKYPCLPNDTHLVTFFNCKPQIYSYYFQLNFQLNYAPSLWCWN